MSYDNSKDAWFERFRLEGIENVQRDFSKNRWKHTEPQVHEYAREWLTKELGKSPQRWTLPNVLAAVAVLVAVLAILAAFFVPEVRRWLGLDG